MIWTLIHPWIAGFPQLRYSTTGGAERHGIAHLRDGEPIHVAASVEDLERRIVAPSVKLHLAGIRTLFDWRAVG